jgi:hypothetical protein
MADSKVTLNLYGSDTPPTDPPYSDGVKLLRSFEKILPPGIATDQLNVAFIKEQTIAALGTVTINFGAGGDADGYGVAVNAADFVGLYVENVEGGAGGTPLQVEAPANPVNWLGASTVLKLGDGAFVFLYNFTAGRVPVAAGARQLLLRNAHGSLSLTARVIALFRR